MEEPLTFIGVRDVPPPHHEVWRLQRLAPDLAEPEPLVSAHAWRRAAILADDFCACFDNKSAINESDLTSDAPLNPTSTAFPNLGKSHEIPEMRAPNQTAGMEKIWPR